MTDRFDLEPARALLDGPAPSDAGHRLAVKVLIPLLVLLLLVVLVFYVFFTSAVVDGDSMYPTLHNTDYLLVTHGASDLHRGDIVVTTVREGQAPVELVKRVIGLPGDVVEIRNDVAYVNGQPEPQRGQVVVPQFSVSVPAVTVPTGSIYVMGDNRAVSEDSRYLGPVPLSGLKGRAELIFAPINRIRILR
jgi:signal peptidase I